ncbi:hypothetical protein [Thauera phenylacetica]|uniref:hypothetical protein n=1 Tax=Thauera phenylacetica TaxID=164400 RepID=UPI0039E21702
MHRIDGAGATVDNKFTQGNPVTAVPATTVTDAWLNDVQDEILGPIVAAGITPAKGNGGQLLEALGKLNVRVVDSVAQLKALDKTKFSRAFLTGYYGAGDGGDGAVWLDSADTTSAEDGVLVFVGADGGRWKRAWHGVLNLRQAGAKGDNTTDDELACQAAAAAIRAKGGGTLYITDGTFRVWKTLPTAGEKLFDWSGCRGVTVVYSNAKIVAERPNTATGDAVTVIIHGLENVQRFTVINPAAEQVGSVIPANGGIVQFGVGMAGGANQSSGIKIINARQIGGLGGLIVYPSGAPNDRAHTIEMDGYFEGVYYPQNFQGNGDNYKGRITARNCGRSYFPYNVSGHDVYVDSNNGTASDDINISAYTNTAFRNETNDIRVRYKNYGSASLGNALHFGFVQSDGTSRSAVIRDVHVDLDVNVGTYPGCYATAKKYDFGGAADNAARGHTFLNITICGSARGDAAQNPIQFFNAENWTGEYVQGLYFKDLYVTSQSGGGQAWVIDGRGLAAAGSGLVLENIYTNVPITRQNIPLNLITIRNVSAVGLAIDGDVGDWTISYLPRGLCLLTRKGGIAVANGGSTVLTLPFADKRAANPHVVVTPKGVQCKFTASALTSQTFSISHDHTAPVVFDVFVMMYV